MKKTYVYFLLATLAWAQLHCQTHFIDTKNENITCELSQMGPEETRALLIEYDIIEDDLPHYQATWNTFVKFQDSLVVLKTRITNNSSETIYIAPEEYIEGIKDFVIPKHKFLYFYKMYGMSFLEKFLLFTVGIFCSFVGPIIFLIKKIDKRKMDRKYDVIARSAKKYAIHDNSVLEEYSEKTFLFKLEPGCVLEDLFFTTDKDLDTFIPKIGNCKLLYTLEPYSME